MNLLTVEQIVNPVPIAFRDLTAAVQACRRCPTMEGRRRVLGEANGPPVARVMFIAEAPGRRGGEVTGIPLSRDASGLRFTRLLSIAGLSRDQVFITNAVLCNPRTNSGVNRPPSSAELRNCSGWLRAQIAMIDASVIVTLGAVALAALDRIERHDLRLKADAGRVVPWNGRLLVPLYHPSPRAGLSRSYADQDEDFRRLGALLVNLWS
jgi:uracil-DNA glycosylase family 4